MQTWEGIQAKLNAVGQVNSGYSPYQKFGSGQSQQQTRDDIIASLNESINTSGKIGGATRWDVIKGRQSQGGYGATIDPYGTNQFNTYEDWKNWFMEQHPENDVLSTIQPMGGKQTSTPSPTAQPSMFNTTTQPMGGSPLANLLAQGGNPINRSEGMPIRPQNMQSLPQSTIDLIAKGGLNTFWENPYFKKLFNK